MKHYAGIPEKYTKLENSKITLTSIPYDKTSTWGKGADKGFDSFLDASENMELYDIETNSEVYYHGISILPPILENKSPELMRYAVYQNVKKLISNNKFNTFFGGEHSISIGIIQAYKEKYKELTVLQLDAHADLRKSYMGTENNHACALHWASQNTNLIQVGIRSMDILEYKYLNKKKCYFAHQIHENNSWMDEAISKMTNNIYLTIDLDVFDPSIMPSTGTPEPGGMNWYQILKFLKKVFQQKNIVGLDIVELAPIKGILAPNFLTAKLYYKLLTYKFSI